MKKFEDFKKDRLVNESLGDIDFDQLQYILQWIRDIFFPNFDDFDVFPYINAEMWSINSNLHEFKKDSKEVEKFCVRIRFTDFDKNEQEELDLVRVVNKYQDIMDGVKDITDDVRLHNNTRNEINFIIPYNKIYDPNLAKSWGMVNKYSL
jgi:hypothetical protein